MKKDNKPLVNRCDIYYADLSPVIGSEQGGCRPVLVVQNDIGNKYAPTTIIAPITSRLSKKTLPTHVLLPKDSCGITVDSVALMEQLRTVDKARLKNKLGTVPTELLETINKALHISLELD